MTDGRLERALSEAIADLAGTSAPDYLDDILERTSRTRQRPWWTFPGRYAAMTPTLKFATAATVAFALGIGASMLILPQSSGPTTAPAAPEPSPVASPEPSSTQELVVTEPETEFEAAWEWERLIPGDADPATGERHEWRIVETSDPRFDGTMVHTLGHPGVTGFLSYDGIIELENGRGSWTSEPYRVFYFGDGTLSTDTVVFTGRGDYKGLTAIVEMAPGPEEGPSVVARGYITMGTLGDPPEIPGGE